MLGILVKRQILLSILTLLLGACGGGEGGGRGGGFNEPAPGTPVTVSGTLSYEFVPPNLNCAGLNFSAIEVRPIRGATVVLLNGTGGAGYIGIPNYQPASGNRCLETRRKIVEDHDVFARGAELLHDVATYITCTACNQDTFVCHTINSRSFCADL